MTFFWVGWVFAMAVYFIGTSYLFGLTRDELDWRFAVRALVFGCFYAFFLGLLRIAVTI